MQKGDPALRERQVPLGLFPPLAPIPERPYTPPLFMLAAWLFAITIYPSTPTEPCPDDPRILKVAKVLRASNEKAEDFMRQGL
jgi:hypothetical protein